MTSRVRAHWERCAPLSERQRDEVRDLLARTERRLGREAIDEGRRRVLVLGHPAEHWLLRDDAGPLRGYAMVTPGTPPVVEACGGGVDPALRAALLARHGTVRWWVRARRPPPGRVERTLEVRQRRLPLAVAVTWPADAVLRPFDPDRDVEPWLTHNNRAFADHPEQGAWRADELRERLAEPWFDAAGFLVLDDGAGIRASCWTKVRDRAASASRVGEIYAVSVDPRWRGRGLGRAMVVAGADALHHQGVDTALLFVERDNVVARALYASLGFEVVRTDVLVRLGSSPRPGDPPAT
ncbi:MAG: GNAT family N-acetyltransferase [Acidimicrobiales bacterium]